MVLKWKTDWAYEIKPPVALLELDWETSGKVVTKDKKTHS